MNIFYTFGNYILFSDGFKFTVLDMIYIKHTKIDLITKFSVCDLYSSLRVNEPLLLGGDRIISMEVDVSML